MKMIDGRQVYQDSDFTPEFWQKVEEAKAFWCQRIEEWHQSSRGEDFFGAKGARIWVNYLPPRHRNPKIMEILTPPLYWNNMCAWYSSGKEVVQFLKDRGIDCGFFRGYDD